jgi:apolipoprotein N-acyltransferase
VKWLHPAQLGRLHNRLAFVQRAGLPLTLGALYTLGFAPFHLWPFSALAIIGLVITLDGARAQPNPLRSAFWRGWLFSLGAGLAGLFWIANAFLVDAATYGVFAPFALFGLAGGLALFWGAAGWAYGRFRPDGWRRAFLFAALFGLTEWLRATVLTGFPWNLPGHIWAAGGVVSQITSVIGVNGLSMLTLFGFASIVVALEHDDRLWPRALPVATAALSFMIIIASGQGRLHDRSLDYVQGVGLRIVHADIPQNAKWQPENRDRIIERYLALSASDGLESRTHIIWPESALPLLMLEEARVLDAAARRLGDDKVLMTGTVRRSAPVADANYYNAMAALRVMDGLTTVESIYDKQRLVPFGEFIPLGALVSRLGIHSLAALADGFQPGRQMALMTVPGAPVASPQICYEAIFSGFTPRGADRPGWIVNISNDAWFGTHIGPQQFFNQTRYRAIEEGVPLIRAAVGGTSAVVDPYGRALVTRDAGDEGVVDSALPQALPPPLYALIGDVGVALFILIGGWVGFARRE